jgi:hypothetical protein
VTSQRNAPVPLVLAEARRCCMLTEPRASDSPDPIHTGHQTKPPATPNRHARSIRLPNMARVYFRSSHGSTRTVAGIDYLDGFSPNVQDILDKFEFRNQIPRPSKADALGALIEKFLDPAVNLSPYPVKELDGSVRHPGLDNHAMGTIFEELVRRFNEENNEEAGEHWTPRDAVSSWPT